jgi:hypothetical protein
MEGHEDEKMALTHEPVPGYRGIFFAALAVGVLYLAVILGCTLF